MGATSQRLFSALVYWQADWLLFVFLNRNLHRMTYICHELCFDSSFVHGVSQIRRWD